MKLTPNPNSEGTTPDHIRGLLRKDESNFTDMTTVFLERDCPSPPPVPDENVVTEV